MDSAGGRSRGRARYRDQAAAPEPVAPSPSLASVTTPISPACGTENGHANGHTNGSAQADGKGRGSRRGGMQQPESDRYRKRRAPGEIIPTRPDTCIEKTGRSGVPIRLRCNRFEMHIPETAFYQYEVEFHPSVQERYSERRNVLNLFADRLGVSFDANRNIYTTCEVFPVTPEVVEQRLSRDDGDPTHYVKLRFIKTYTCSSLDQRLNAIVGRAFNEMFKSIGYQNVRDNYYDKRPMEITNDRARGDFERHGVLIYPGYETSAHIYDGNRMLFTLEYRTRVETCSDLLTVLGIDVNSRPSAEIKEQIQAELMGKTVQTTYSNRSYRVDDLMWDVNIGTMRFETMVGNEKREISLVEYYRLIHNVTLPNFMPFLVVSRPKRRDRNRQKSQGIEEQQNLLLVPSLLKLAGLMDQARADRHFMSSFTSFARQTPDQRNSTLLNFMRGFQGRPEISSQLRALDWKLDFQPVEFNGRVLPPEVIKMIGKDQKIVDVPVSPQNPDWTSAFRGNYGLRQQVNMPSWIVCAHQRNEQCVDALGSALQQVFRGLNIPLPRPRVCVVPRPEAQDFLQALKSEIQANGRPAIIVIILPGSPNDTLRMKKVYDLLKTTFCIEYPCPTQFVMNSNVLKGFGGRGGRGGGREASDRMNLSVATKVGLQMQAKVGGVLWGSNIPAFAGMILGYDVYHDTLNKRKSVAAMIATIGSTAERYFSRAAIMDQKQEIVTHLEVFVADAIRKYMKLTGQSAPPKKIIVYRDGVSDGMVYMVKECEKVAMERALAQFECESHKFELVFVICKKHTNVRFFHVPQPNDRQNNVPAQTPRMPRDGGPPPKYNVLNPPPGTVVDNTLTRPELFDFYLVPQSVGQGTVTPCCYNVIHDTSNLGAERIQALTYKLCHMYFNWSGTIRIPAVCQYAHKLAFLVGNSIHQAPRPELEDYLYYL